MRRIHHGPSVCVNHKTTSSVKSFQSVGTVQPVQPLRSQALSAQRANGLPSAAGNPQRRSSVCSAKLSDARVCNSHGFHADLPQANWRSILKASKAEGQADRLKSNRAAFCLVHAPRECSSSLGRMLSLLQVMQYRQITAKALIRHCGRARKRDVEPRAPPGKDCDSLINNDGARTTIIQFHVTR